MLFHLALFSLLTALIAALPPEKRQRESQPQPQPQPQPHSDLKAFDVSQAQAPFNPNFWKCTHDNSYQKVVIRGWQVSSLSFASGCKPQN